MTSVREDGQVVHPAMAPVRIEPTLAGGSRAP